ncbi:protease HtpX [Agaribacterium haliotis]|uniref:protease HtpX n=1 Tax=Agaribacterium haliotis TaxID=2013869 RepID=UPI000BB55497|nr:protease HtpX [Agaribacterium haliotis]
MKRIGLFLATNFAVLIVAGVVLNLLGVNTILAENGSDLNVQALLVMCAVFGFSGSLISLFMSKWIAKKTAGVQIIDNPRNPEERWLLETVRDLSQRAGIGMPEVGIFPAQQSNAFATGANRNNALVAVSAGLMQRFNKNEIRAVLGHEIGHVANGDMITLTLVQGVVNTFVMFFARIIGHVVDRAILKNERGYGIGYFVTTMVAQVVLAFLANIIVAWFSRKREFRADIAGAQLADRESMIAALRRLQEETRAHVPNQMPDAMRAFGISSGFTTGFQALFATHPPLERRIAALQTS